MPDRFQAVGHRFLRESELEPPNKKQPNENPNPPRTMAIKLNAAYSKKLGLPNYSSHSFAASVEVELTDPGSIAAETARLYGILQTSVDNEIRQTGFLPGNGYGLEHNNSGANGSNGQNSGPAQQAAPPSNGANRWQCSDKQRKLIGELTAQLGLSDQQIDERAQRLFGQPAHQLNKLSASGLISDLLEEAGSNGNGNGRSSTRPAPANRNGGGA